MNVTNISDNADKQGIDPRTDSLLILLQLERDVRRARDREQLKFIISNDTHRLVPYSQCVFFTFSGIQVARFESISSLSHIDHDSPFLAWLRQVIKHLQKIDDIKTPHEIQAPLLPDFLSREWTEWSLGKVLYCTLTTTDGVLIGGLWLSRTDPWKQSEKTLLEMIADIYAYSWQALEPRRNWITYFRGFAKGKMKWLLVMLLLTAFIPIHQTALAPAQVVAREPIIVSAPMDGVIDSIQVKPNQVVDEGETLFRLEDTNIRNRHEAAVKSLAVARANHLQASQKAFADTRSKSELAVLKAKLDEKQVEVDYTAEMLDRIQVKAKRDGVVLFGDPNDWLGKPVSVGEKVMTLADVRDTWLEIWLPVDDAIALDSGADVRFFLNIDPVDSYNATVKQSSYEAILSPRDILSYRLKASFEPDQSLPRLGLKGTAKIYGRRVPLYYYIFRRPIAEARRLMGW